MRHIFAILVTAFFAIAVTNTGCPASDVPAGHTDGTVRVGDLAPDFSLTTLDGKAMRLSEIGKGRTAIILFWSYFCFPCQSEMPELQAFHEEAGDEVGILTIALDGPQYNKYILPYIADKKLTIPIAYDRESEKFYETAEKYGVFGTPTFFVLDDTQRIRFIHLGRLDKEILGGIVKGVKSKSFCAEIVKPPVNGDKPEK